MLKRMQRWLGSQAPINVPEIVYWIVGVRHTRHRMTPVRCYWPCEVVHRSFDDHVACMRVDTRADHIEYLKRAGRSEGELLRGIAYLDSEAALADTQIKSLRW